MQSTVQRRHRATCRPARKNTFATAGAAGLAVSMLASGVATAQAAPAGAANPGVDVTALAQQAKEAALQNSPISVSANADWSAQAISVDVEVRDARAERRARAEEESRRRVQETERETARSRAASRSAVRAAQPTADTNVKQEAPAASSGASSGGAVAVAYRYLGTPYRWGGSSPSGFDCSGFTSYVYRQLGINLPHSSTSQARYGRRVSMAEARPGDLMWRPGHVGIYIGNGKMIHAPRPGKSVQVANVGSSMAPYRMR
ncbi:C40 family peptidase [Actinomycetaceae bacterium TAE3-ERU4]|nr:C40 family peptidase [Actinomycetaceae bacterium TAE3-ERU4]